MKRKWEISNKERHQACIDEILQRLADQGEAAFGYLAADDIIGIVANYVGPEAYNKAVSDARAMAQSRFADLDVDLGALEQRKQ